MNNEPIILPEMMTELRMLSDQIENMTERLNRLISITEDAEKLAHQITLEDIASKLGDL